MGSPSKGSNELVLKSVTDPSNQPLLTISTDTHQLTGQCLTGGQVMTVFATIVRDENGYRIECGTDGLIVNQQPTQSVALNKGDIVQIGYAAYQVISAGNPASQTRASAEPSTNHLTPATTTDETQQPQVDSFQDALENSTTDTQPIEQPSLPVQESFEPGQPLAAIESIDSKLDSVLQNAFENLENATTSQTTPFPQDEGVQAQFEASTPLSSSTDGALESAWNGGENIEPSMHPVDTPGLGIPSSTTTAGLSDIHEPEQPSMAADFQATNLQQQITETPQQEPPVSPQVEQSEPIPTTAISDESPEQSLEKLLAALKSVDNAEPSSTQSDLEPPTEIPLAEGQVTESLQQVESALSNIEQAAGWATEAAPDTPGPQEQFEGGDDGPIANEMSNLQAAIENDTTANGTSPDSEDSASGFSTGDATEATASTEATATNEVDIAAITAKYFQQSESLQPESEPARPDLSAPSYINQTSEFSRSQFAETSEPAPPAAAPTAEQPTASEDVAKLFAAMQQQSETSATTVAAPESDLSPAEPTLDQNFQPNLLQPEVTPVDSVASAEFPGSPAGAVAMEPAQPEFPPTESPNVDDAVDSWRAALAEDADDDAVDNLLASSPVLAAADTAEETPVEPADVLSNAISSIQNDDQAQATERFGQEALMGDSPLPTPESVEEPAEEPVEESVEEPAFVDTNVQQDSPVPAPSEPEDNSVAAVLARMQMSPELESTEGLDSASDQPQTFGAVEETMSPVAMPEPVASPPAEEDSADVQNYMNSLLQRLNGGEAAPAVANPNSTEVTSAAPTKLDEAVAEPPVSEPVEPLKAEEFVPQRVAPEVNSNMVAMRELANAATKNALVTSEYKRTKTTRTWLLTGAVSGLLGSVFFFLLSHNFADIFSIASMISFGTGVVSGGLFAHSQRKARNVAK